MTAGRSQGATYWNSAIAHESALGNGLRTTAPAIVTGAIAPASVKGETTIACPRRAQPKAAVDHRLKSCFKR